MDDFIKLIGKDSVTLNNAKVQRILSGWGGWVEALAGAIYTELDGENHHSIEMFFCCRDLQLDVPLLPKNKTTPSTRCHDPLAVPTAAFDCKPACQPTTLTAMASLVSTHAHTHFSEPTHCSSSNPIINTTRILQLLL